MTHATVIVPTPAQQSTCETCTKFTNHNELNGKGWCNLFDKPARRHHQLTQDCILQIETEQIKELLSTHNAFLKPIALNFPGRNVFKQSPDYGFSRIGYVGKNYVGWFAHDKNGLTVAERLPSKVKALTILLNR